MEADADFQDLDVGAPLVLVVPVENNSNIKSLLQLFERKREWRKRECREKYIRSREGERREKRMTW